MPRRPQQELQQYLGREESREGQREPSTLGRVLGVSSDFITPQLCDLGKFTSPLWALGSSPEKKKNVSDKLCPVGLSLQIKRD